MPTGILSSFPDNFDAPMPEFNADGFRQTTRFTNVLRPRPSDIGQSGLDRLETLLQKAEFGRQQEGYHERRTYYS